MQFSRMSPCRFQLRALLQRGIGTAALAPRSPVQRSRRISKEHAFQMTDGKWSVAVAAADSSPRVRTCKSGIR